MQPALCPLCGACQLTHAHTQVAFTRSLSSQLLSKGIRVNAVAPGPVWTPLIPASFPPDEVEKFCKAEAEGPKRITCMTQPGATPADQPPPITVPAA